MTTRTRLAHLVPVAALALALVGCGGSSKSSSGAATFPASATTAGASARASNAASAPAENLAPSALPPADQAVGGAATTAAASGAGTGGVATPTDVDRKVIVTVNLDVQVSDVSSATVKATSLAEGVGGEVFSQQTNLVVEHPTSTIVFKVPPGKVNTLLASLGELGKVQQQQAQADDVTAQFVDLESRITSAERSVVRARDFLDKATTVSELSTLEAELARRETERDQLLGQKRVLEFRTGLATVTLTLTPAPTVATTTTTAAQERSVSRALHNGSRSVGGFLKAIAMVLAFLLPWSPFLVVTAVVIWLLVRRATRASSARQAALVAAGPMPPAAYPLQGWPTQGGPSAPVQTAAASAPQPVPAGVGGREAAPEADDTE